VDQEWRLVMASTVGFVGTVQVETPGTDRVWFSLVKDDTGADWVKVGRHRAWFTMSLQSSERPAHMAQLTLLLEAMRSSLEVKVVHGGAVDISSGHDPSETFEVSSVRVLRHGLHF
jgi:hypothetical protein